MNDSMNNELQELLQLHRGINMMKPRELIEKSGKNELWKEPVGTSKDVRWVVIHRDAKRTYRYSGYSLRGMQQVYLYQCEVNP